MIKGLINLANHLDKNGYKVEASFLDSAIKKISEDAKESEDTSKEPGPLEAERGFSTPRPVHTREPSLRQKQQQLNKSLAAIRHGMRRSSGDSIDQADNSYHAKGFGLKNDVNNALELFNKEYPNYQMDADIENLGLGKGWIVRWVEKKEGLPQE